jgi:bacillithiol biosynthesis cysteine-adding enzyme BshC
LHVLCLQQRRLKTNEKKTNSQTAGFNQPPLSKSLFTFTAMHATRIPYPNTNSFSPLVLNYLAQSEKITPFFGQQPTRSGFANQVEHKRGFSAEIRKTLVARLKQQYSCLPLADDARGELHQRITLLENENTFTVTTGHQLCLFTGPLYTVYKILHVIRLAEELSQKLENTTVLPIFWMATEDHDFAEINHIRYNGHKVVWHAAAGDAVGRMSTSGMGNVLQELRFRFPQSNHAEQLLTELEAAYFEQSTLANATRALVHKWFGHLGILCLDGDDAELKRFMIPAFSRELSAQVAFETVSTANEKLVNNFGIQVNPRDINLFYLRDGQRSRLTKSDEDFMAVGQSVLWRESEILAELHSNPERFSPNVLLRPLYQETILPNLGYIGGGGEVAYWAQLKPLFDEMGVPFPIVLLRQSVQLLPKRISQKLQKLELTAEAIFSDPHELTRLLIARQCDYSAEITAAEKQLTEVFSELAKLAAGADATLLKHVEAQKQRALKSVQGIEKKMFRAAKRSQSDALRMVQECRDVLKPGGGLQERHDNILQHMLLFGPGLVDEILRHIQPLNFEFISLTEA